MTAIPLRERYRNPNSRDWTGRTKGINDPLGGTRVWMAEKRRPNPGQAGNGRSGQSKGRNNPSGAYTLGNGKKNKKRPRTRPRRRAYGPW